MSLPWFKFVPSKWRGDQALRAVSPAARGMWIDCLCIMHEAKPYGHLVLNGAAIDDDTLARMTGVPVDVVRDLMSELRKAGVLSVTGKGVVFSRRMARDHALAQKGRKAANKRWSQDTEYKNDIPEPTGFPSSEPNAEMLEIVEGKIENIPPPVPEPARALFDEVWEAFPQNPTSSEAKALAAFNATKAKDHPLILAAALRFKLWFAEDNEERKRTETAGLRYVQHLANWIESGDWRKPLHLKSDPLEQSPDLVAVRENTPEFEAIKRHRGKAPYVGNSGTITVTKAELAQAIAA